MRILADQDVYKLTIDKLKKWGHHVATVKELGIQRASSKLQMCSKRTLYEIGLYLKEVKASMNDRITIDPDIQHGKPVIKGTRVPVARIIGGLAGGMTKEEIIREYEVSEEDIRAALTYAGELIEQEVFHPLPK